MSYTQETSKRNRNRPDKLAHHKQSQLESSCIAPKPFNLHTMAARRSINTRENETISVVCAVKVEYSLN